MADSVDDLGALAGRMRHAVTDLLGSLTEAQRSMAWGAFDEAELTRWTYLPGPRPGVEVRDLGRHQRSLLSALLATSFSERGWQDAERVVHTEAIRSRQPIDPEAPSLLASYPVPEYYLRVLGDPATESSWLWRLSGHHLVAQATVIGDVVSTTPQFFGTQPARVSSGPLAGFRGLPAEEDLARQLVTLLGEDQRRLALVAAEAPADILSRDDPIVPAPSGPRGLSHAGMDHAQRLLLEELIGQYLNRATTPVSNRAWDDLRQAGLGDLTFGWAGGLAPGQGHYYAVTGPTVLLEYDNTQEGANHVHSVWRDLRRDWGGDLLRSHYDRHDHASPAHLQP